MTLWVRPVLYPMNQMFGQISGAPWGVVGPGGHPGCDYAGPMGSVVGSASAGVVLVAGQAWDGGFGYNPVVVYHPADNVTTLYGHMESHIVAVGQQVYAGQPLGLMDSQGYATGSHLHAELRSGEHEYGYYGDGITSSIDVWLHDHGAYGGTPWSPAGQLTTAQRNLIKQLQGILHVYVDGAWGVQTDNALEVIRYFCLNRNTHSTVVAQLQKLWGQTADGNWGPKTDQAYWFWRWCFLNK
jgi:hypothetical protein